MTFTGDLAERQGAMDKYAFQASDRSMMPRCAGCIFEPRCTGVPHVYRSWHGDAEFVPVRAKDLPRLDPQQRAFVDGLRGALATLAGAEIVTDPRQRRVELRTAGGTAWLLPSADPLPEGLWPIATSAGWRLGAIPGQLSPRGLVHAQGLARQLDPDAEIHPFDLRRAARLRGWLERLDRYLGARTTTADGHGGNNGSDDGVAAQVLHRTWRFGALELALACGEARQTVRVAATAAGERPLGLEVAGQRGVDPVAHAAFSALLGEALRLSREPTAS